MKPRFFLALTVPRFAGRRKPRAALGVLLVFAFWVWAGRALVSDPAVRPATAPVPIPSEPIFHVETDEKIYAIAVNVDWGEEHLEPMLAVLEQFGARVTFFPTGRWAKGQPQWIARFVAAGHEVGNHGMSHHHPKQLANDALRALIEDNARLLRELTDGRAVNLFAPPYGEFDGRIVEVARGAGHATVMWTIDTVDWKRPPAEVIVRRVMDFMRPGAIVLTHPVEPTVAALPEILRRTQAAGYAAVPVGELIRRGRPASP